MKKYISKYISILLAAALFFTLLPSPAAADTAGSTTNSKAYLLSYANSKETKELGNSLHLAYSTDGVNFTALNSNTGICFAKNTGTKTNTNFNGLKNLYLFRKADGKYGLAASNSNPDAQNQIYLFDSDNLIDFTNERILNVDYPVGQNLQVKQENGSYRIYWSSGTGQYSVRTEDLLTITSKGEISSYQAESKPSYLNLPDGAEFGNILEISKEECQRVVNKLGVVKNTKIRPVEITAQVGETLDLNSRLPKEVTAEYSDGTSKNMKVAWNNEDIAKVTTAKDGTFTVRGTVQQDKYASSFIPQRADPCILKGNDGYYYFTASYPMLGSGDKNGYDRIVLRRSQTLAGLASAAEVTIFDCNDTKDEYRFFWAPEIRLVNGQYYIFYTSSMSSNIWDIRPHVLKCTNSSNLLDKSSWKPMGVMQKLSSDGIEFRGFSLDMTVFENKGKWYAVWAQIEGFSSLFIAEISKEEPWKCISDAVKISVPEYSWERINENVNEGPSILKHNGKIYLAFSASATGPEYCVGLLSIAETANMLDASAWKKQPYPVLTSADVPGEYGPGHNSFTVDEKGNPIFVYHARGELCYRGRCAWPNQPLPLYDPCRDANLKRVHFAADGTPILKMSDTQELASANKTIKAVVKIGNGSPLPEEDKKDESLILHWDMTKNGDGTLKDVTGNGKSGKIVGMVSPSKIENIDVMELNGGYVEIPDGAIGTKDTEVTVNMLVKVTENVKSSWMWCIGSSDKRYMYLTARSNHDDKLRGGVGCVPDSGGNGWEYESWIGGSSPITEKEWQNITVTYRDKGEFIFYKNGVYQAKMAMSDGKATMIEDKKGEFTLQNLMKAGDSKDGYMGGSFYSADPKFKGAVADFRIYNRAMADDEVSALQEEIEWALSGLKDGDFTADDIHLTEAGCLGSNVSKDAITKDLSLPKTTKIGTAGKDAVITGWKSSHPNLISENGNVKQPILDTKVTLTASVTRNGKTAEKELIFTVLGNATDENRARMDADEAIIHQADDIRGNITLPTSGECGSKITWTSSNEAVISSQNKGTILAGVVNRQKTDTEVTLTATASYGSATAKREIVCRVRKAPEMAPATDYLFAYFPYTNTKDERIYFGISEDGLNFKALNNQKPVLESVLGTHGLRDPFIMRSHEGDKFYLIATDLTVAGITQNGVTYPGQDWGQNQVNGSKSIMVWESEDLINWSNQRMCKIAADTAGCTWAPEAYWDDETQQYVVFWASKYGADNYGNQRVFYATTRDFYTFSKAEIWIEEAGSVIDTTVIKAGEYYYRYTKNEDGKNNRFGTPSKRVYCERSKSLLSKNWELVHNNSLNVGGGQIEGPCIFKLNADDVERAKQIASLKGFTLTGNDIYCLAADATGVTIFPGLSSDITTGSFHVLGTTKSATAGGTTLYSMPEPDASHGTIMPVTSEEYNNLMLKYDQDYARDAADLVGKIQAAMDAIVIPETVTENITLPVSNANGVSIA